MLSEATSDPSALPADPQLASLTARLDSPAVSVADSRRLTAAWSDRYWTALPESHHVVVDGQRPTLYDCFDHADVLVSDVSSVVSDFLASGKPYVCANPQGMDETEFRQENPTAGAAYLLGPDCTELAEIVALVRGADPMEADRAALREYLLGPQSPPSLARWKVALDALMIDTNDDRTAREIGVDESVLEAVDDPEHASSETPTM
jgi:hypothetical protein